MRKERNFFGEMFAILSKEERSCDMLEPPLAGQAARRRTTQSGFYGASGA